MSWIHWSVLIHVNSAKKSLLDNFLVGHTSKEYILLILVWVEVNDVGLTSFCVDVSHTWSYKFSEWVESSSSWCRRPTLILMSIEPLIWRPVSVKVRITEIPCVWPVGRVQMCIQTFGMKQSCRPASCRRFSASATGGANSSSGVQWVVVMDSMVRSRGNRQWVRVSKPKFRGWMAVSHVISGREKMEGRRLRRGKVPEGWEGNRSQLSEV